MAYFVLFGSQNGWISNHVLGNPTTALSCPRCSGECIVGPMVGNHRKPLLPMVDCLKNYWHQWLSWYHSINGNGMHVSSSVTWEQLVPKIGKPSKNHPCRWLIPPKTVNGDGEKFSKPSQFHRCQNKTITIPSPQKIDHGSSLHGTLVDLTTKVRKCGSWHFDNNSA